jgi:lysophospholipase L1-like esterase
VLFPSRSFNEETEEPSMMPFSLYRSAQLVAIVALLSLLVTLPPPATGQATRDKPAVKTPGKAPSQRWEKEIQAFEAADRKAPPPRGAVLFIGSSTIRLWKTLAQDFPEHRVINRGFGGSQIADCTAFAERIIFPYEPRTIFLRAGGNDLHAGKSPEQVFADFKAFVARVHAKLPDTEIVYISLSPAIARWTEAEKTRVLNRLVKDYVERTPRLKYVEAYNISLSPDGTPRPELFAKDRLHFNAEGYKLLAQRVRPYLPK